jgi:hypothetical protein
MDKKQYTSCMASGLKGKQMDKNERKTEFCILSKTCSGKASSREQARVLCAQPKAPKVHHQPRTKKMSYDPDDGPPQIPDGYEIAGGSAMEI